MSKKHCILARSSSNNDSNSDNPTKTELDKPVTNDVDPDLYAVLALATDEELEDVYTSLYDTSLLSPLAKSLQSPSAPVSDFVGNREGLIKAIDRRFRFLAADADATLRGRSAWPTYRSALLAIHYRLQIPCSTNLATQDLEAEIFLFLLNEHADAVDAASTSSSSDSGDYFSSAGDGMAGLGGGSTRKSNFFQKAFTPLKLGAKEVLPALSRFVGTVAVTNMQVNLARQLGNAFVRRRLQYEAATQLAAAASSVSSKMAVRSAQRGLAAAATRYGAARSLLSVLGPVLWAITAVDLAKMSVGTDYARIVKAVFQLAQIRLLRTDGWMTKSQWEDSSD